MRTLVAVMVALVLAGCAVDGAENSEAISATAPAVPAPSDGVRREGEVGVVRAPAVLGDVPIQSTSPEVLRALRVSPPVSVAIEALDIDMAVSPVGVEQDGAMEVPQSAAIAGWYQHGPAPGASAGNAVLAAHVDDAVMGLGPFSRLIEIEKGTHVVVSNADGEEVTYVVEALEQTGKRTVDMDLLFERDGEPRLILVTCGGRYDRDAGHYEDNVVVSAAPIDASAR